MDDQIKKTSEDIAEDSNTHKVISKNQIVLYLSFSLIPVVLLLIYGLINNYILNMGEFAPLLIPLLIFVPLVVGSRIGINFFGILFSFCFWMVLVVLSTMLFW